MSRSHPIARDFSRREVPLSQLSSPLSSAAESGDVGRGLGFLPARQRQPPRQRVGQQHVAYVWPASSTHHPHPRSPGQPS